MPFLFVEFQNAETLTISEVFFLLHDRKQKNEKEEDDQELSEVFVKTLDYCERFGRFKNRDTVEAVRK